MKVSVNVKSVVKILNKRIAEVSKLRDQLRYDISEFESILDTCERALDDLQSAVNALSELA